MTLELTTKFYLGKWSFENQWATEDLWAVTGSVPIAWMFGRDALNALGDNYPTYPIPEGEWSNQIWVKVEFIGAYTVKKNIYLSFTTLAIT